jgi:hypothetical protein
VAKLPVTVTMVKRNKGGTFTVTVAYFDGSVGQFIVPVNLATVEAVTISAMAMAALSDIATPHSTVPGPGHRRYLPRIP